MTTLKHGKNLIVFTMSDFSNAPNLPTSVAPEFIHPTIVIRQMQVQDALLEYKQWGERASLDRAERLRKVTGNTLYLSTLMSCREGEIEIGWQMNKVKGESPDFIHRYSTPYAAQIKSCGFHPSTVAILSKIVKWCEHRSGWNTPPESVVDALKSIKASSAVYDRDADEFILQDHQECDNYFGMPDDLRVETIKTTVGPVIAN